MNFSMIYELRDRLETAVIAGVGLIQEDFRLKKAIQQIEPLAKASPVFGKIYQMACKSVEPSCEDRAGVLLDTLALVDAVLCTQGSLQKEGELKPIKEQVSLGNICTNVPYSQMAPVLEAFNGTGSGRYATLRDTYKNQPEIFEDYRVKGLMVKALGDSYSELADMVAEWLEDEGVKVLPLLKQGFNPQGKRDMAKRVQVIEAIAGKDENEFYLEMLPKAGKEVKEALVFALHNDKGNEGQLLDLVKAEKGKVKEAALYSLSYMEGSASLEYWNKQMKKNPQKTVTYLRETKEDWASDLVADSFIQWLDNDHKFMALLLAYCFGMVGYHMLIFASGIERIGTEYYEAATLDGANRIQQFRYITMPLLKGVTKTNITMWSISSAGFFLWSQLFSMVVSNTQTITPVVYMYQNIFGAGNSMTERNAGIGAAVGVLLSACVVLIFIVCDKIFKDDDIEF